MIGRAPDALVTIDDGLVSRRHAMIHLGPKGVTIEDTGSRNGVIVNGQRIESRTALAHGDHITIGGYVLLVVDRARGRVNATTMAFAAAEADDATPARPTSSVPPRSAAQNTPGRGAFGLGAGAAGATGQMKPNEILLTGMVDALTRNDDDALRFATENLLGVLTAEEQRSEGTDPTLLRRASTYALRGAVTMRRPAWIDAVIAVHAIRPRTMHAATIDALEGALERESTHDRSRLRAYVAALETQEDALGVYEKFCVDRLRELR